MIIKVDKTSTEPLYRQVVSSILQNIREGHLRPGDILPSMNSLADDFNISRETVKKAYGILTSQGTVIPKQGKGFYIAEPSADIRPHILLLFDKFSDYKQIMYNAFSRHLEDKAKLTILIHNQDIDLLRYYLDNNLDRYDYYVVTPHFPLDKETQSAVLRQLARIPNRKLILLDRIQTELPGRYGAVYQDFENDIYDGLRQALEDMKNISVLRVITWPQSLYGHIIQKGVKRFTGTFNIHVEFLTAVPDEIREGDCFLLLNPQFDAGLVDLTNKIRSNGLEIGSQAKIISYNEFDINELVLGGLTTVSTDFREMGRLAAEMIKSGKPAKIHCPFRMNRRHTF